MDQQHVNESSAAAGLDAQTLAERIWLMEPQIVYYRELPNATPETFRIMFAHQREIAAPYATWVSVADLSEAKRPNAIERAELRRQMATMNPNRIHLALVVPDANLAMRAMGRILAFMLGVPSTSVHSTKEAALEAARRVLRK